MKTYRVEAVALGYAQAAVEIEASSPVDAVLRSSDEITEILKNWLSRISRPVITFRVDGIPVTVKGRTNAEIIA